MPCHGFSKYQQLESDGSTPRSLRVADARCECLVLDFQLEKTTVQRCSSPQGFEHGYQPSRALEAGLPSTAVKAVSLIPPTMWSHNESLVDDPYDP